MMHLSIVFCAFLQGNLQFMRNCGTLPLEIWFKRLEYGEKNRRTRRGPEKPVILEENRSRWQMENIMITGDSTCDLSQELKERYLIETVPLYVNFGEGKPPGWSGCPA